MRRRYFDITFFFSLACSLLINTGMVEVVVYHTRPPKVVNLNAWRKRQQSHQPAPTTAPDVVQNFPLPQDNPVLPPPPKQVQLDNREVFGESGGIGDSLNSSPGAQPIQARQGPTVQAFLGRIQPGGGGGAGGGGGTPMIGASSPAAAASPRVNVPTPNLKPSPPHPQQQVAQAAANKPQPEKTSKLNGKGTATEQPPDVVAMGSEPVQLPPAPAPVPQPPPAVAQQNVTQTPKQQVRQSAPQQPQMATNTAPPGPKGAPGPPGPKVEPAPPSDRESDPFSDSNSFKFVNGRVLARNGRWVKTVKPQLTDAGWIDASLMNNPAVTFLATVDEEGNVVHVMRYQSSGSDNIDLPCEEALNQWKIEPSKDANGHYVKDVVAVTFGLER